MPFRLGNGGPAQMVYRSMRQRESDELDHGLLATVAQDAMTRAFGKR